MLQNPLASGTLNLAQRHGVAQFAEKTSSGQLGEYKLGLSYEHKAKHGKSIEEETNPYQSAVYQVRASVRRLGVFRVDRDRRQRWHPRMDAGQ